jgi:hypothetical protein
MAIDFETEEKSRRWIFIVPVVLLSLALCVSVWAYTGKVSDLKELEAEHRLATLELEKYRKLYLSTSSNVRGTEQIADLAEMSLQECQRANIEIQDQLNALELSLEAGATNTQ